MNPDRLLRCIENEKNGVKFTNLPRHFIEIAQLVMSHAGGDMPKDRAQRIKLLVEDISNLFHIVHLTPIDRLNNVT